MITVASDLGGRIPDLAIAGGFDVQSTHPFRDMTGGFELNRDPLAAGTEPLHILESSGILGFPSLAAYRVLTDLDVGVRITSGFARVETQAALWGYPGNYEEAVSRDAVAIELHPDGVARSG